MNYSKSSQRLKRKALVGRDLKCAIEIEGEKSVIVVEASSRVASCITRVQKAEFQLTNSHRCTLAIEIRKYEEPGFDQDFAAIGQEQINGKTGQNSQVSYITTDDTCPMYITRD
ncbi:hypothetical protein Scep_007671 [Stephania cephalantha]|uniref:Uncharacterized protein n=1 Tax=Stephania cephalantha TaxID=152367 RepID=A0AAP0PNH2_9MAGN